MMANEPNFSGYPIARCVCAGCAEPVTENDRLCVGHSESPSKDPQKFSELVKRKVGSSDLDFSQYIFPVDPEFIGEVFSQEVDFRGARFLQGATFVGSEFAGAHFSGSVFQGANFAGASLTWASFFDATFEEEADFSGVVFSKTTGTAPSATLGIADFNGASFKQDVTFSGATFGRQANFAEAEFAAKADFSNVTFESAHDAGELGVIFERVSFKEEAVFDRSTFGSETSFKFSDLQHLTFRSVNMSRCLLTGCGNIDKAEFDDVRWAAWPARGLSALRARAAVADELAARTGDAGSEDRRQRFRYTERIYRGLRASYEARRDHPRVSDFYFGEMEMRRLTGARSRPGQVAGSLTAWYGLISGYGERWVRALGWFTGVLLVCAALYMLFGLWIKTPAISASGLTETHLTFVGIASAAPTSIPEQYGHAALHSFLVATLIGRDIYALPANAFGQVVQAAEAVLGPLLLGLMGLAIRRQFQR